MYRAEKGFLHVLYHILLFILLLHQDLRRSCSSLGFVGSGKMFFAKILNDKVKYKNAEAAYMIMKLFVQHFSRTSMLL